MKKKVKLFIDLDGTIAGSNDWVSYLHNTLGLFKTGVLFDIPKFNWSILTSRPQIDLPIIHLFNMVNKLYPIEVITPKTLFYNFNNKEEVAHWKSSYLSRVLANELFVKKVIYIDNDPEIRNNILSMDDMIICSPMVINELLNKLTEEYK